MDAPLIKNSSFTGIFYVIPKFSFTISLSYCFAVNKCQRHAYFLVCKMNVHKRCEKNVANNCGINTRDMAEILKELGISGDKLSKPKKV